MKKFLNEFKEFAMKGNVMDLAVGVIIGAAFQSIVTSLTEDIISPIIGLVANMNFSYLTLEIFGISLKYGSFLTAVINFIIMAFVVFMMMKGLNKLASLGKKEEVPAVPTTKKCPYCLSEIPIGAKRCPCCTSSLEGPIKESMEAKTEMQIEEDKEKLESIERNF